MTSFVSNSSSSATPSTNPGYSESSPTLQDAQLLFDFARTPVDYSKPPAQYFVPPIHSAVPFVPGELAWPTRLQAPSDAMDVDEPPLPAGADDGPSEEDMGCAQALLNLAITSPKNAMPNNATQASTNLNVLALCAAHTLGNAHTSLGSDPHKPCVAPGCPVQKSARPRLISEKARRSSISAM
ncbi:hypothetical protein BD626DRAFT_500610 [Schizophyllum amplum]|uniref:Uncharacterized protein n=1 Tax=Schizophyllum amplum TaxID=97359 RepID=A0A550CAH6_9AGAR|nr:hypothetical protein BD626DRAFT_500610 [Auriculariopsis ampla]